MSFWWLDQTPPRDGDIEEEPKSKSPILNLWPTLYQRPEISEVEIDMHKYFGSNLLRGEK